MQDAAFSTGVSIQYPKIQAAKTSKHQNERADSPFPFPTDTKVSSEREDRIDTKAYSMCQELAYHFVCKMTRDAVQDILQKSNDTSYNQVLTFLQTFCTQNASMTAANDSMIELSPSGRQQNDSNTPVIQFPAFHGYPTASIIAGTDATSSDLWMKPLMHKLQRTFPLCIILPRDVATARRLIEWLAARLALLIAAKQQEEKWLEEVVETFDMLPPKLLVKKPIRRMTRHHDAMKENKESDMSDENFISSTESEQSDTDCAYASKKKRKKQRRAAPVAYGRWTMSKLLVTIQNHINELLASNCGDTSREYIAMIEELVQTRLDEVLSLARKSRDNEDEIIIQIITCFDAALSWLQTKLTLCRNTAVKLLNVASESKFSTSIYIGSTEMALALILQRVLCQYTSFLDDCKINAPILIDRRKLVKKELIKHRNYYSFSDEGPPPIMSKFSFQPFLVLCIEQLEVFSQQVFGDFLEIWTHFVRHHHDRHPNNATNCTLGFVIGVASATSPALRRLNLSITNCLELQFFSLVDSRKCFDDILESLVVNAKLPLTLSGDVLQAIARRHRILPSVPRLLLALRLLLFTHFRSYPWSFLALAVDIVASAGESPILFAAEMTHLPSRVSIWLKRQRSRVFRKTEENGTSLESNLLSWLTFCSDFELSDLSTRVFSSDIVDTAKNWTKVLELALESERRRRRRWRLGWECFRTACSWLDVRRDGKDGEDVVVMHLALALDGRLGETPIFTEIVRRIQTCRWVVTIGLIQQWKNLWSVFGSSEDEIVENTLSELATLCAYARSEKTRSEMLKALRNEIVTVFKTRLVIALLQPRTPDKMSKAELLVSSWSVLKDASVLEDRLRFEYHDHLRNVLQEAGIGDQIANSKCESSWVHDIGLAFLFYQESASASLSLCEWYESFSFELEQESNSKADTSTKKQKLTRFRDNPAIKARFVRAVCTLRHWGFLKNDAPRDLEQDIIEKLVFI
ncbi:Origin recognition complex, subunit 3 [Plasmopara halstedii]|uniref:Origin recognition complex, subunit 3 n=1 Tax=Plasmopara halstedii TaxID=4781 RepID=A0A0N7L782_PLAHL|nr:Origin recognition complex, subunit 3 [Plasmopara halstedii]CEG46347.1 Origin recognition complex, subunit 3 [Plasmopara halstedii]|eukprot:XP_024582716.1 Origin recognition complex, subunit 3 [Plasmopara halstedii]